MDRICKKEDEHEDEEWNLQQLKLWISQKTHSKNIYNIQKIDGKYFWHKALLSCIKFFQIIKNKL